MKKRFDYAVALISHLKERSGPPAGPDGTVGAGGFIDIREVAETSGLPRAYLEKVAQELKRAGWLESRKGAGGGYRLKQDGGNLSIEALMQFYSPIKEFCPLLREIRSTKFEIRNKSQ